jgi:hypothetical protein
MWKKGIHESEEHKKKISEVLKKGYATGKYVSFSLGVSPSEETKKKISESFGLKPNGMELYLDSILQNHFPDEWKFVGDGQVIIGGLCPDFINVNGKKKIIELFGHFWHEGKIISKGGVLEHRTEAGKKKVYGEIGYDTLVIWDDELDNESKVIEKINRFLFDTR